MSKGDYSFTIWGLARCEMTLTIKASSDEEALALARQYQADPSFVLPLAKPTAPEDFHVDDNEPIIPSRIELVVYRDQHDSDGRVLLDQHIEPTP